MLQGRNVARESSLRTAVCAAMWGTCCRTTVVLGRSTKLQQQLVPARLGLNSAGLQPAKDICCVPGTLRTCENRYFEIARLQLQVLLPNKSVVRGMGNVWGSYCLPLATLGRLFLPATLRVCLASQQFEYENVFPLRNNQSLQQQQQQHMLL